MIITNIDRYRDGGTIGICCDNHQQDDYSCNPGVLGTKACIGKPNGDSYNPTQISKEEMQRLCVAIKLYRTADKYKQVMINQVLGVMHEVYGLEI